MAVPHTSISQLITLVLAVSTALAAAVAGSELNYQPECVFTSPKSGDSLALGSNLNISWSCTGYNSLSDDVAKNQLVLIELHYGLPDGSSHCVDTVSSIQPASDGSLTWYLPETHQEGNDYYLLLDTGSTESRKSKRANDPAGSSVGPLSLATFPNTKTPKVPGPSAFTTDTGIPPLTQLPSSFYTNVYPSSDPSSYTNSYPSLSPSASPTSSSDNATTSTTNTATSATMRLRAGGVGWALMVLVTVMLIAVL